MKTFKVIQFLDWANTQLARNDDGMTDAKREGICSAIEHLLLATGNYQGYNNLYWLKYGIKEWEEAGKPETFPEKDKYIYGDYLSEWKGSRYARKYYTHEKLKK